MGACGTAGAFGGGPGWGPSVPAVPSGGTTGAVGAYAGAGGGFFITNATGVGDLLGPFDTVSFNSPVVSVQLGYSNGIAIVSVVFGPGEGVAVSSYPTVTCSQP